MKNYEYFNKISELNLTPEIHAMEMVLDIFCDENGCSALSTKALKKYSLLFKMTTEWLKEEKTNTGGQR